MNQYFCHEMHQLNPLCLEFTIQVTPIGNKGDSKYGKSQNKIIAFNKDRSQAGMITKRKDEIIIYNQQEGIKKITVDGGKAHPAKL